MGLLGGRIDVLSTFRFVVELDGLIVGGFSEVSGLEAQTDVEEYQEGGLNSFVHRLPKGTKYSNIVLKRGLSAESSLWNWYAGVIAGKFQRKSGAIIMRSESSIEVCRWNFFGAYPVKWDGPQLNATRSEVAIESLELAHNGFKMVFNGLAKVFR